MRRRAGGAVVDRVGCDGWLSEQQSDNAGTVPHPASSQASISLHAEVAATAADPDDCAQSAATDA
eukprot:CAMPEP_0197603308 /NCGR_PEP_ID=MMETSP1326-20131121/38965_1 /TAXON_ID=1155430 /ORGANISM="Genus nov. species nov., Strain RCC2288" /LENGTH=64 /DNA_ID=CAMNT_0043170795 /DNA_START=47 /DNA_END=239 /DNA_ORIENTATION=+